MLRLCICRCPPARSAKNGRRRERPFPPPTHLASCLPYTHPPYPPILNKILFLHIHGQGLLRIHVVISGFFLPLSFFPLISSIFLVGFAFHPLFLSVLVLLAASLRLFFSFLLCKISLLNNPQRPSPAPPCGLWLRDSLPFSFIALLIGSPGFSFSPLLSFSLFLRSRFFYSTFTRYDTVSFDWGTSMACLPPALSFFLATCATSSFFYVHDPHTRTRTCPIYACTHRHTYSLTYLRMSMNQTCTTLL